jgi:hypothetical protein
MIHGVLITLRSGGIMNAIGRADDCCLALRRNAQGAIVWVRWTGYTILSFVSHRSLTRSENGWGLKVLYALPLFARSLPPPRPPPVDAACGRNFLERHMRNSYAAPHKPPASHCLACGLDHHEHPLYIILPRSHGRAQRLPVRVLEAALASARGDGGGQRRRGGQEAQGRQQRQRKAKARRSQDMWIMAI